jgi:hypothetical protein
VLQLARYVKETDGEQGGYRREGKGEEKFKGPFFLKGSTALLNSKRLSL